MMKCHELMGFMPSALASEILEFAYTTDKALYRSVLAAAAEARKVRLVFYERKPRTQRHGDMLALLTSARLDATAGLLLQGWLTKSQTAMLTDFLNTLGITHKEGIVEQFPATVDDGKLNEAVELLLGKYPKTNVAVYLHAVFALNDVRWPNLEALLDKDSRLQF
jgi:hypothetical protein